jgi:hypothetical protein
MHTYIPGRKRKLNQMSFMMLCYVTGEKFKDYLTVNPQGSFKNRYVCRNFSFFFNSLILENNMYILSSIIILKNVKTMRWIVMIEYRIDEIYDWSLWHAHAWALRPTPSSFSGSSVETNFFFVSSRSSDNRCAQVYIYTNGEKRQHVQLFGIL